MTRSAVIFSPDAEYLQRLATALQTVGLFTMTAETEKEARALLHDLPFDVALIDEAVGETPERIHSRFRQINGKAAFILLAREAIQPLTEIRPGVPIRVPRDAIPEILLTVSKLALK